jgi:hypothetical protein
VTKHEWASIQDFLLSACRVKAMAKPQWQETARAYFKILGDLDHDLCQAAAEIVVLTHHYATLPAAGAIRMEAAKIGQDELSPEEAWLLAVRVADRYGCDPELPHARKKMAKGLEKLPLRCRQAVMVFGWNTLQEIPEKRMSLERERFVEIYRNISATALHHAALPPSVKALTEGLAEKLALDRGASRRTSALPTGSRHPKESAASGNVGCGSGDCNSP